VVLLPFLLGKGLGLGLGPPNDLFGEEYFCTLPDPWASDNLLSKKHKTREFSPLPRCLVASLLVDLLPLPLWLSLV
jgi:hypothetical protein